MEYPEEVDIADDDDEYAIGNDGDNEPLAEGNDNNKDDTPAPPAAVRASYS
jgi:hypothetical protein